MKSVAVLGGGAGGLATTIDLGLVGHRVRLWNRRHESIAALFDEPIEYQGVLGSGRFSPDLATDRLSEAIEDADIIVVVLPAITHQQLADELAGLDANVPIILNPGATGGALHFAERFRRCGQSPPGIVEFSTLTYTARRYGTTGVSITGKTKRLDAAALPGNQQGLDEAVLLFPNAAVVDSVLSTSLSNLNMVMHPPGAVLSAAWVEATAGAFTFYVEAMTPGVGAVMAALDDERRAVGRAFGLELPSLVDALEMAGLVPAGTPENAPHQGIREGKANQSIAAPDGLGHRYYLEDFGFGLLPLLELGQVVGLHLPVAQSLFTLAEIFTTVDLRSEGFNASSLGIENASRADLLRRVGLS